ncbi:MAG: hypothetical protein EOP22_18900 [Hyphomicrobiales bacterium]|nr:MAG: hypothetical protein EOP22_18900 [Hyphomicrobiales bacterium]
MSPASPPPHGPYLFELAAPVLASCSEGGQDELKRIAELSMALHYVRLSYPPSLLKATRARAVARMLLDKLDDGQMLRLLGNTFLLQQHVTPYIFLRAPRRRSTYYEGLVETFLASELQVRECTPYRRLERAHLLYKLGAGDMDDVSEAAIFSDAQRVYFFNRDLSYALTHTLLYATDFSTLSRPDPRARFACLAIAAMSHEANDVDLFFEASLCLMGQELPAAVLAELQPLVAAMRERNPDLFAMADPLAGYHPLLVYDLLRGAALRHHAIDLADETPELDAEPGLIRLAGALCLSLKGKDLERIESAYAAWCAAAGPEPFVRDMVKTRLATLRLLASTHILFEREFVHLGRRDASLYAEYLAAIDGLEQRQAALLG